MDRLELNGAERLEISQLLIEVADQYRSFDLDDFLDRATVLAHDLPLRLRLVLNSFRLERLSGLLVVAGHDVDQDRLGPTPSHWRERQDPSPALREELLLVLYATLLGDPFGWATQQDGKLIHDVLPIRGHEHEQLGSSSKALLTWHTEDAFHPLRSDHLLFACLRNPYSAATTVGSVDDLELSDKTKAVLFEERFMICPDESHRPYNNSSPDDTDFAGIEDMQRNPDRVAVLFGDPAQPYIRADPYFMSIGEGDDEARLAFDELVTAMDGQMYDVELSAGDYCFLDNFRVVHGRKPFKARHDGTDRWLKRISVTSDLRKSRAARRSSSARAIN